ncbi:MAG TPA: hypothetical protein VF974_07820 [Patescibacteria group bacterium]
MIAPPDIIKGILQSFYFEADKFRSYQTIERICKRALAKPERNDDSRYAMYDVFYPLLRWGVIEYYGDNRFRVSPAAAISHSEKVLVCHSSSAMNEILQEIRLGQPVPGISLYRGSPKVIDACRILGLTLTPFNLLKQLTLIPPLGKLIDSWSQEEIFDPSGYFQFNERSMWVQADRPLTACGLYKKSEKHFSAKVIRLPNGKWKSVPARRQQLDGFSLAVLWSRIQNNKELGIYYIKEKQLLVIQTHFFPVALERLLSINTLLSDNIHVDITLRKYYMTKKEFAVFNKFFHNAIQIK